MTKKALIGGAAATALVGVLAMGTVAASGPLKSHRFGSEHQRIVQAVLEAKLDIVAERLDLTDTQRQQVGALKDRLLDQFQSHRPQRVEARQEFAEAFGRDDLDRSVLEAMADARRQHHEDAKARIFDAVLELHSILTPEQRDQVSTWIAQGPRGRWNR